MQKSHKLSIIIPCYNCATTLEEAVTSVYTQKLAIPFEIVMVDDGSTDATRKVMEKLATQHSEIRLIFHEKNRGGGAARNTGIKNAAGDLIFCLDGDDILPLAMLPKLINTLDIKQCDGIVFEESRFFRENREKFKSAKNKFGIEEPVNLGNLFIPGAGHSTTVNFLYTKNAYENIGGYPEHHGFDTQDFGTKFLTTGHHVFVAPHTYYFHRQVQKTKSYFERVYEQGLFSRNYYLIIEDMLHILSPSIREAILGYDIYAHTSLHDNLKSYLEQFYQKTPGEFFAPTHERYLTKDGIKEFIKKYRESHLPADLFVLAVHALNEKQYTKAETYLVELQALGYHSPIIAFNMARARLGATGRYLTSELPDKAEAFDPELKPKTQGEIFQRNFSAFHKVKAKIKRIPVVKMALASKRALKTRDGKIKRIFLLKDFFSDLKKYQAMEKNDTFASPWENLKPCIMDKTNDTPVDPVYFYQDSWCAKKVFENKPMHHYDIGSKAEMIGIISQFTPSTMVDIRPINLQMPGFSFQTGDIIHLPFKDGELNSVSSICVVEHIGLGRYGDALDPYGSEKAIDELKRVLAPGGNLYISVPIDDKSKIYFNAHRAFTRDHIVGLLAPLELLEEKYIYGRKLYDAYDAAQGFGTGMYHFRK